MSVKIVGYTEGANSSVPSQEKGSSEQKWQLISVGVLSGKESWDVFALVRLIHKFFLLYNGEKKKKRNQSLWKMKCFAWKPVIINKQQC